MIYNTEELKPISGFEHYYISNQGNVYSNKSGILKKLKPFYKNGYTIIKLKGHDGYKHLLIHRLVAQAFIPNKDNLPVVNHKDKNRSNNNVSNLEWCTNKQNLEYSYTTMSPDRNHKKCILYEKNIPVKEFPNIKAAARYAHEKYGCSYTSLRKYYYCGDISIVMSGQHFEQEASNNVHHYSQDRRLVKAYYKESLIGVFKSVAACVRYINTNYSEKVNYNTFIKNSSKNYHYNRIENECESVTTIYNM